MPSKPIKPDFVVITAKRLDSDDAEEAVVEVKVPETEFGQQAQLRDLVRDRYPDAEFRSFANEAASFLAHKLLIVAVYQRSAEDGRDADSEARDDSQEQLFAA